MQHFRQNFGLSQELVYLESRLPIWVNQD